MPLFLKRISARQPLEFLKKYWNEYIQIFKIINSPIHSKYPSKIGKFLWLFPYNISWPMYSNNSFWQINLLHNNLSVTKLHSPLSTYCDTYTFSLVGFGNVKSYVEFLHERKFGKHDGQHPKQFVVELSENENLEEYFKACGLLRCDPV